MKKPCQPITGIIKLPTKVPTTSTIASSIVSVCVSMQMTPFRTVTSHKNTHGNTHNPNESPLKSARVMPKRLENVGQKGEESVSHGSFRVDGADLTHYHPWKY